MNAQQKKSFWKKVEARILAGDFPPVIQTPDGRLALARLRPEGKAKTLPPHLAAQYPAEIVAAAAAERAAREAAAEEERAAGAARLAARHASEAALRAEFGGQRVWRLTGLYLEDASLRRYTLAEIEAWLEVFAAAFDCDHPVYSLVCETPAGDRGIDISWRFQSYEPRRAQSFENLCASLRDFTELRRRGAAGNN